MPGKSASNRSPRNKKAKKPDRPRRKTGRTPGQNRQRTGPPPATTQRLQRLLASAGFGSRRQCEELIEAGRVEVDGTVVTKLGTTVDEVASKVRVDGVLLKKQKLVYYAVNKPIGFVTTNRDPQGRPRVVDLVPPDERVFPVGRLDRNSEGLILLTNDGELAQKLTHPKFGVRKVYRVTVAGKVDFETMKQMRKGIYIAEGFVRVEGAKLLKTRSRSTEMEIVLREGKNREIRRILARLGHKVQHLRRIAVGPLRLGDVPSGAYRIVSHQEVQKLRLATEASADETPRKGGGKKFAGKKGTSRKPPKKPDRSSVQHQKKAVKKHRRRGEPTTTDVSLDQPRTTGAVIGAEPDASQSSKRESRGGKSRVAKKSGGKKRRGIDSKVGARRGTKRRAKGAKVNVADKKRPGRKRKRKY